MTASENNLVSENWGLHINRTEYPRSFPPIPEWADPLQKKDWSECGLIVWDANIKCVTHLYASHALKIMQKMNVEDAWKVEGIMVGSPAYEISLDIRRGRKKKKPEEFQEEKPNGKWVLTNQISLPPSQAQDFYNYLVSHEGELQQIASAEEDKRKRLAKVYEILLKYAPDNTRDDPLPTVRKKVFPISIPEGKYLTIAQIVEFCNETTRRVNKWIDKDGLPYLEIPQIGKLVQVDDLNTFLAKSGRPLVELQE